jgi:hypothetical protein
MKNRFGFAGVGGIAALAFGVAGCGGAVRSTAVPSSSHWRQAASAPASAPPSAQASVSEAPSAPAPVTPAGDFAGAPAPMAPTPYTSAEASSSPPPASRSGREGSGQEEAELSPAQRPGLGTEWGETRYSQVHEEPFTRAAADPFALLAVRYDDRPGVEAMTGGRGGFRRASSVGVANGWISMSVRGEHGSALDAVSVGDRTYVVGQAGERYSILLSNRTGRRFEAVATVDGLDVINGQPGSLSNRGYLLEPHATLAIDGFRQSDDTVAAFRFGKVAGSYAAQTGSARDVGVIGVAFFAERGDSAREDEARLRETATPFPGDGRYARPPL